MPSRGRYRCGLTVNLFPEVQEFHTHYSREGKKRKYRGIWKYRPTTESERATLWLEIETSRWVRAIAPTQRDKTVLYYLRCLYPDIPLDGDTRSSWQKKNAHYRGRGYHNADQSQYTLRDAAVLFFTQRGRCKVCAHYKPMIDIRPNAPYATRACTDHNHDPAENRVRGLLCELHNKGIGHMGENKGEMGKGITYLHDEGDYEGLQ